MTTSYNPDTVSPPGETLADWLDENGIDGNKRRIDWAFDHLGLDIYKQWRFYRGYHPICESLAQKLEQATQIPASFWLERERRYRESLK